MVFYYFIPNKKSLCIYIYIYIYKCVFLDVGRAKYRNIGMYACKYMIYLISWLVISLCVNICVWLFI